MHSSKYYLQHRALPRNCVCPCSSGPKSSLKVCLNLIPAVVYKPSYSIKCIWITYLTESMLHDHILITLWLFVHSSSSHPFSSWIFMVQGGYSQKKKASKGIASLGTNIMSLPSSSQNIRAKSPRRLLVYDRKWIFFWKSVIFLRDTLLGFSI